MADSSAQSDEIKGERLKYLDFVQEAVIRAVVLFSSLYAFAKHNAGPLRQGVQTVEDTVKAVVNPVYEKLHDVPFEFLKFLDRKVEEVIGELEHHVPSVLKTASAEAYTAAQRAPVVARSVAGELQRCGVTATAVGIVRSARARYGPATRELYVQYEPVMERYLVATWRSLNRLPVFPKVGKIVVLTAAYWVEKYNQAVGCAAERGYAVAEFLPLLPTKSIIEVFGGREQ